MLARCAVLALLGIHAGAVRREKFSFPTPAMAAAAEGAHIRDVVPFPSWPEDVAKHVSRELKGFWHDSRKHVFHISEASGPGNFGFYDLSQKIWANLRLSNRVFFEGAVDGKVMRFSFRRSANAPPGLLVAEVRHGSGDTMQWLATDMTASTAGGARVEAVRARTAAWSRDLTVTEVAAAETLLGTWRKLSATADGPETVVLRAARDGHLEVVVDGASAVGLHSVGPTFEGMLEDIRDRRPARFTLGEHSRLLGEIAMPGVDGPRWRVSFRLYPLPSGIFDLGNPFGFPEVDLDKEGHPWIRPRRPSQGKAAHSTRRRPSTSRAMRRTTKVARSRRA